MARSFLHVSGGCLDMSAGPCSGGMATSLDTLHYICDQAGLRERLTFRKMFGEYALYLDDKTIAFVCDDQLFLKPTPEGRALIGAVTEAPPYPGAKNYFLIVDELDDPERLRALLVLTGRVLPIPKPKARSAPAAKPASSAQRKTPARTTKRKRRD